MSRIAAELQPRALPRWAPLALLVLALAVYAVGYDQGLLLQPLVGKLSSGPGHLHEFFHDARHLLGFPCH